MSYKDLSLQREAIVKSIENFPDFQSIQIDKHPQGRYNATVKVKSEHLPAMINVIHLSNGNTTINTLVGKNKTLSEAIAQHIVDNCRITHIESKRLYIKIMTDDDFKSFIDYLSVESTLTVSPPNTVQNALRYDVEWHEGGNVHVNRFHSKAFSVQGNSNHIKAKIVEILTQVIPYKDVIDFQLQSLEINTTSDQVLSEIEYNMPNSFPKLSQTLLTILSPSFALKTSSITLTDYSAFTFPILRVIEGVLRVAYNKFGITIGDTGVGTIFDKEITTGQHSLQQTYKTQIHHINIVKAINDLYKVYYNQRHQLFHVGDFVNIPRTVETKDEAVRIIVEAAEAIEEVYKHI